MHRINNMDFTEGYTIEVSIGCNNLLMDFKHISSFSSSARGTGFKCYINFN
jgi:hypothetical protein